MTQNTNQQYSGNNQQGYNNLINLGYSHQDAMNQANANQPNPNFYPTYGPSGFAGAGTGVPQGYTGSYYNLQGQLVNGGQNTPQAPQAPVSSGGQPAPFAQNNNLGIVDTLNKAGKPSDFNSRSALAKQYGIQNYSGTAQQNTDLAAKFRAGFQNAQASGQAAPQSTGAGSAGAQGFTPPPTPEQPGPSPIENTLKNDPGYQQLLTDHATYLNTVTQRQSLVQEYKSLQDSLGLPSLNAQLMDMKHVIDGTEDDVRTEITKSGGFATNSQVMALSAARNKVLVSNYNNLLDARNNAQTQLTTLIGLSKDDRAQADQQFNQQMEFDQKVMEYRDKAVTNSKSAYEKIISTPGYGYKALYSSTGGDPHTVSLVEDSLGLRPGMLKTLSAEDTGQGNTHIQLSDGRDVMVDKMGNIVKTIGGPKAGSDITTGSSTGSVSGDVKDILEGRNTMFNIRQTMGRTNKAAAYMEQIRNEIRKTDPSFDFVASDAGGKSVSTGYVQRATAAINSVLPNIDKIVELSDQVGRVGVRGVDALLQKGQIQIGNQKVSNFHEAQKLIADEIGVALGAGSVSDMKLQLGFDVTDPNVKPEVFASNMKIVKEFINNRKSGLDSLRYKSSTQNSSGGQTHDYNGVTYKLINGTWTPQ